ncbi:MAG: HAD-IIIA family hydrolase [Planctomycetes bacterium]|nr:HAD-IIIA family hydrolase [Planctomycetota bacterium]
MAERRFVILDRDGTLIVERNYLSAPDQVELLPGAARGLRELRALGLGLIVVTNQSGLGRGFFDRAALAAIHARLAELLAAAGVQLDGIFFCPHLPEAGCACRKPKPLLVEQAGRELGFAPRAAFVVGDKPCDVELGRAVGAVTLLVRTGYGAATEAALEPAARPDACVADLVEAAAVIRGLLAGSAPRPAPRAGDAGPPREALILCGGEGRRLRAAVADRPKPLATVAGRPFLDHLLEQCAAGGVTRVLLCSGYRSEQIEEFAQARDRAGGLRVEVSREPAPLGTGGALRLALARVGAGPFLVLNGDSFCAVACGALWAAHARSGALATVVAARIEPSAEVGSLELAADGRILAFREKDPARPSALANAGVYVLARAALERLAPDAPSALERDLLPALCREGAAWAFLTDEPFWDIGTPERLARAEAFFARRPPARLTEAPPDDRK